MARINFRQWATNIIALSPRFFDHTPTKFTDVVTSLRCPNEENCDGVGHGIEHSCPEVKLVRLNGAPVAPGTDIRALVDFRCGTYESLQDIAEITWGTNIIATKPIAVFMEGAVLAPYLLNHV